MTTIVECHSGYTYAERPIAIHHRKKRLEILSVLAEWQEPDGKGFRVMTEDMQIFDLFYHADQNEWKVESAG